MLLSIAVAREQSSLSVPILARAIGIDGAWCWDLLGHADEFTGTLSLRQALRAASVLGVSWYSLLPEPVASAVRQRSFIELAASIRCFCAERGVTVEQFGELAGWEVQEMLAAPDTAFDVWNIDCLRDVCATVGLHWPDFLSVPGPSA